jgi:hypothetical protein
VQQRLAAYAEVRGDQRVRVQTRIDVLQGPRRMHNGSCDETTGPDCEEAVTLEQPVLE